MRRAFYVVIAVMVAAVGVAGCGSDDNDDAACVLSIKAISAVARSIKNGEGISTAIDILEPGLVKACGDQLRKMYADRTQPFDLTLRAPSGDLLNESTSLSSLLAAPTTTTQPTSATIPTDVFNRIIACVKSYDSQFLVDLCTDGTIDPT